MFQYTLQVALQLSPHQAVMRKTGLLCLWLACCLFAFYGKYSAASDEVMVEFLGKMQPELYEQDEKVFFTRVTEKLVESCAIEEPVSQIPSVGYKAIRVHSVKGVFEVHFFSNSIRALGVEVYRKNQSGVIELLGCSNAYAMQLIAVLESKSEADDIKARQLKLSSYEPNSLGWTFDDNDVAGGYMDFKVSLRYPLFNSGQYSERAWLLNPFLAFTGRFSQYIGSVKSSPVIAKRFNPKLFVRHWLGNEDHYIDFGYAHESNGQSVESLTQFQQLQEDLQGSGQSAEFARNYISRGWDYVSLDWKAPQKNEKQNIAYYINLKHFLENGLLQTEIEEYNEWEYEPGITGKQRREVDGITALFKYRYHKPSRINVSKLALLYTTGISQPFANHSIRGEATFDLGGIPLMVWASHGYNSDLVDYYKKVNSVGIALELNTF